MKNNQGFAGAGIIIIIVAILAVGGAYYLGTQKAPESIYQSSKPEMKEVVKENPEESSLEIFNNQPGMIKFLQPELGVRWVMSVDLLSKNPDWGPGKDGSEFFVNKNTEVKNLIATRETKMYECGSGPDGNETTADVVADPDDYINSIISSSDNKTKYFDINGINITAIYDQCLP